MKCIFLLFGTIFIVICLFFIDFPLIKLIKTRIFLLRILILLLTMWFSECFWTWPNFETFQALIRCIRYNKVAWFLVIPSIYVYAWKLENWKKFSSMYSWPFFGKSQNVFTYRKKLYNPWPQVVLKKQV